MQGATAIGLEKNLKYREQKRWITEKLITEAPLIAVLMECQVEPTNYCVEGGPV